MRSDPDLFDASRARERGIRRAESRARSARFRVRCVAAAGALACGLSCSGLDDSGPAHSLAPGVDESRADAADESDFEPAPLVPRAPHAPAAGDVTHQPSTMPLAEAARPELSADPARPGIGATTIATTIFEEPRRTARRLGYVRLGGVLPRSEQPVSGQGCSGFWYAVEPLGFICTDEATTDLESPLLRAARRRPALDKPLPYPYGFVRATAPQYLRVPTFAEQTESEFKLLEHLQWYEANRVEVQRVSLGANDVPLDAQGMARIGQPLPAAQRLSTQLTPIELLGGKGVAGEIPFWLRGGRQIPNVSGFEVPAQAVFADRVRRKTGLSFIDAFMAEDAGVQRGFAVTVDLRLVPATKVKPDSGSSFHGVALGPDLSLPFAMVARRDARGYQLLRGQDAVRAVGVLPHRAIMPMSGNVRFKAGKRFYQTARDPKTWLAAEEIAMFAAPPSLPKEASLGRKWIDVSLVQQTLVLYEGSEPKYATLVSSGRDRLGDPKTERATPRGHFAIQSKHIAAAMDSEENSSVAGGTKSERPMELSEEDQATIARLLAAEKAGKRLDTDDRRRLQNVKKGRHPEYGVTHRRGSSAFELRDVPWIQYFDSGFALHGAYWHDVFGVPRSHGCINLSPIDARVVFNWTDPELPEGWHGMNTSDKLGPGTAVVIRE